MPPENSLKESQLFCVSVRTSSSTSGPGLGRWRTGPGRPLPSPFQSPLRAGGPAGGGGKRARAFKPIASCLSAWTWLATSHARFPRPRRRLASQKFLSLFPLFVVDAVVDSGVHSPRKNDGRSIKLSSKSSVSSSIRVPLQVHSPSAAFSPRHRLSTFEPKPSRRSRRAGRPLGL